VNSTKVKGGGNMPKDTFFNLPEEKRLKIEVVAIDEFAANGYDKASINRIVDHCQIAKGSFYQYFRNKKDLFKYILERAYEEKLKFMSPVMENPEAHDFFTLLKELYMSGLKFGEANPKLMAIGNQLLKNKDHAVYQEILGESKPLANGIFKNLLELAISRGEVRENIDVKFISFLITSMNVSIIEYYFDVVKADNIPEFDDKIMDTVNLFLDFIKNGIGYKDRGGTEND